MFFLISMHSTATLGIPLTSPALKPTSFKSSSRVKPRAFTSNLISHLHTLYTQSFRTTLAPYVSPRLLAHSLPGLPYKVPSFVRPCRQAFTTRRPPSDTRHCSVTLSRIAEDSRLQPPVGVWTVSQFQCGRSTSQSGYRSSAWWALTPPTT